MNHQKANWSNWPKNLPWFLLGPGEAFPERFQHGGVMRRGRGLVPVQRIHPESRGQTMSKQPHAHQDKTGASRLAGSRTNHEHLSLLLKKNRQRTNARDWNVSKYTSNGFISTTALSLKTLASQKKASWNLPVCLNFYSAHFGWCSLPAHVRKPNKSLSARTLPERSTQTSDLTGKINCTKYKVCPVLKIHF